MDADLSSRLLRVVGFVGIAVGAAWALQVLGFGGTNSVGRFLWVMASAGIAGAGTGLIVASGALSAASARA